MPNWSSVYDNLVAWLISVFIACFGLWLWRRFRAIIRQQKQESLRLAALKRVRIENQRETIRNLQELSSRPRREALFQSLMLELAARRLHITMGVAFIVVFTALSVGCLGLALLTRERSAAVPAIICSLGAFFFAYKMIDLVADVQKYHEDLAQEFKQWSYLEE